MRSDRYTVGDPEFQRFLAASAAALGDVRLLDTQVSNDRHAILIPIQLGADGEERIDGLIEAVRTADDDPEFDVAITGEFTLDRDFNELSQQDLQNGELFFGLPAALIVLVLVFGAVVAGLDPGRCSRSSRSSSRSASPPSSASRASSRSSSST